MVVGENYIVEFGIAFGGGGPMPAPGDEPRQQIYGECVQYPGEDLKRIRYTQQRYIQRITNPSPPWVPYDPRAQMQQDMRFRTYHYPRHLYIQFRATNVVPVEIETMRVGPNPFPNPEPNGTNVYRVPENQTIAAQRQSIAKERITRSIARPFVSRLYAPEGTLYRKARENFDMARNDIPAGKRRIRRKRLSRKRKEKRSSKKQ